MPGKRSKPQIDPNLEREAQKYDNPIPSREYILDLLQLEGNPLSFEEIAGRLGIEDEERLEALRRRLKAMERDGQALCNRRGAYLPVNQEDLIRGRVIGHPDGFGFLVPDEQDDDLFLSPKQMRGVFHGDRAVARVMGVDRRGRREGGIVEVLERNTTQVVGRLRIEDGVGLLTPDNKRITHEILVPPDGLGEAQDDQIVVVRIREMASRKSRLRGDVVEVLGEHMAPGMEIDIAIRAQGLPFEWPEEVTEAADKLGDSVPEKAKKGRLDLRDKPFVTIDGSDARDFDDALYCEPEGKGWRLWVAIADVSHYVEPDSALDREAVNRATSAYFPEQVIPMLPEALSNGLCSLNPDVDRLSMVCEMEIGARGALKSYRFHEGVIRSHARLIYDDVAAMLAGDEPLREKYAAVLPHVEELHRVFKALHAARNRRGAIDFDSTETQIVFGEDRKIERIVPVERTDAHRLVEECMIMANVAAARFLKKHKVPALYRNHDQPPAEKVEELREFLNGAGLSLGGGDEPSPRDYTEVLKAAKQRTDQKLIQTVLLRSLSQAVYSPELGGHFGLALDDYAHFTSPIRRYPDLLVHRGIRHVLRNGSNKGFPYTHQRMEGLGEHCSMAERRAEDATRDVEAWLKAEYMQDKVGDVFTGIVSGVTGFGLFVEIQGVYIEGLVHVSSLDNDFYHFDPKRHTLTGERAGRVFRIGDELQVQLVRVSLDDRKIDLALAGESKPAEKAAPAARPAGRKGPGGGPGAGGKKRGSARDNARRKRRARGGDAEAGGGPDAGPDAGPASDDSAPADSEGEHAAAESAPESAPELAPEPAGDDAPKKKGRRRGRRRSKPSAEEGDAAAQGAGGGASDEDSADAPEPGNERLPEAEAVPDKDGNTIPDEDATGQGGSGDGETGGKPGRRRSRRRRPASSS
ncbi:ribonuclease R [Thioalkalivibrio sp. ALR17-21]|uniref:ribonuclease R n=1 Tax=Thioalkalivibrio sp. ALR17-21 TaxID=1269813 RepID=UPI00040865E2|nr:ribonuclease R [Thioalkalivibrio sp. ALR17-21]